MRHINAVTNLIFIGMGVFGLYLNYKEQNIFLLAGSLGILFIIIWSLIDNWGQWNWAFIKHQTLRLLNDSRVQYGLRWQLSTIPLAIIIWLLADWNPLISTAIANFIGSILFYPLDKAILCNKSISLQSLLSWIRSRI